MNMKPYRIEQFRATRGSTVMQYQEAGPNAGGYTSNGPVQHKRLSEFLCDGTYRISAIRRLPSQEVFAVGQQIWYGNNAGTIAKFVPKKTTTMHVYLEDGGVIIPFEDLRASAPVRPAATVRQTATTTGAATRVVAAQPAVTDTATGRTITAAGSTEFLAELERRIIAGFNGRTIRLRATKRSRGTQTLEAFLTRFFEDYNNTRATIYVDDEAQQTSTGRRRSLGDIFMICRYYYPQCTLLEVLRILYITLPESMRGFRTSKCSTIHKRVWYRDANSNNGVFDNTSNDEYGHLYATVRQHLG